jgi:transposase-like protein
VGVFNEDGHWIYLVGMHPVCRHAAGDLRCFRLTVAQLVDSGACRAVEVIKAFGIPKSSLDRALRRYRAGGAAAFFARRATVSGGGRVLSAEVLARAQQLLDEGQAKAAVAGQLGVHPDTLRRAVWDGRLRAGGRAAARVGAAGCDKTRRSIEDAQAAAGLGTGCTRAGERVLAALGKLNGAASRFERCGAVPFGGVLCALGALLENGLLSPVRECLGRISGYYDATHILLLLGFMSLCRIKTVEQLRGKPPGELGKLMGLDRVPEVRCLRKKLDAMSRDGASECWAAALARQWMEADPQVLGTLYVDGHVRVYHGGQTKLPRKYVARQRLCLRGTTDYWVNDCGGRPFFVIDKVVDSGLITALRQDIVPRLLREVPGQPAAEQLRAGPLRCRFTLVFDREGYSPAFFKELWRNHRIAAITYHKHPAGRWPEEEFAPCEVTLSGGETSTMLLAERGSLVGSGAEALWMKEVRKLTAGGHQVSLIGTAFELQPAALAAALFSRWCQENYFRYMMEHFEIDLLTEYKTGPLHDTEAVINPAWRQLERQRNALDNKLRHRRARFAQALTSDPPSGTAGQRRHQRQQAELLEEIAALEAELATIKERKKQTARHIPWAELPAAERFTKPLLGRKRLLDAVHMIAYRAETALCELLRSPTTDQAAARRLLQDLFLTEADLLPDPAAGLLHVEIHRGSRPAVDRTLENLFGQLNELEITFPGTDLVMLYRFVGQPPPASPAAPENSVNPASQK